MLTTLTWQNLIHKKTRTLVTMAGIAFPILLIFAQLGFLGAVDETALLIYDQLEADVFLISPAYLNVSKPGQLPMSRLYQAASAVGVARALPLYVGLRLYRNPDTRRHRRILVIGFDPDEKTFRIPEVERHLEQLKLPDKVLIDRKTRPEFGSQETGVFTEIGGRRIQIAGQFTMGTGFAAHGALIVSDQNFLRIVDRHSPDSISIGLLQLQPGALVERTVRELRGRLPGDVRILPRSELESLERAYWFANTPVGIIFGIGVAVAFAIGFLILYQVLSSDISRRYPEYATLKAIGYSPRHLSIIVIQQALILALASYVPGFLLSLGFYRLTREAANVPIEMEAGRALAVLGLTVLMSSGSALLSLRKVRAMDPAELF